MQVATVVSAPVFPTEEPDGIQRLLGEQGVRVRTWGELLVSGSKLTWLCSSQDKHGVPQGIRNTYVIGDNPRWSPQEGGLASEASFLPQQPWHCPHYFHDYTSLRRTPSSQTLARAEVMVGYVPFFI